MIARKIIGAIRLGSKLFLPGMEAELAVAGLPRESLERLESEGWVVGFTKHVQALEPQESTAPQSPLEVSVGLLPAFLATQHDVHQIRAWANEDARRAAARAYNARLRELTKTAKPSEE